MSRPSVTKSAYVRELLGSVRKHRLESVLALIFVITLAVLFLSTGGGLALVGSLLPLLMAMILFQFVVASWRVYRTQQLGSTTNQYLADLDAFDRAQSEQSLRTHYHHREQRQEQRYEANLRKLDKNIATLTARLRGDHP